MRQSRLSGKDENDTDHGRTSLRSPISTTRVIAAPSRRKATAAGAPGHPETNELLLTTLNPTQAPLRFRE